MGEKNKVKFSRFIANEWSEPNPGQSRLLCNQTCSPEFCVIQDYITPRKREYVIEFPSLIHYKKGDMITMHFTAPREIIAYNNKGDMQAIYEMLAGLKQQESIEGLEVGVMFCGNNGEYVKTYPAKTTSDRNHTSMDFTLKVEPDYDLSFCEVRYTLFWEPYKLSRKDDGCGCDENQDELSSDWVFDVKLYYHSSTVDEEEIMNTISLVDDKISAKKEETISSFKVDINKEYNNLSDKQNAFYEKIEEIIQKIEEKIEGLPDPDGQEAEGYSKLIAGYRKSINDVEAQNRLTTFNSKSLELTEQLQKEANELGISLFTELKDELEVIKTRLNEDNNNKYEALSSTDQKHICDLHDKILNGTEVREIKEKLEKKLEKLNLSDSISNYKEELSKLSIENTSQSIYKFPPIPDIK